MVIIGLDHHARTEFVLHADAETKRLGVSPIFSRRSGAPAGGMMRLVRRPVEPHVKNPGNPIAAFACARY